MKNRFLKLGLVFIIAMGLAAGILLFRNKNRHDVLLNELGESKISQKEIRQLNESELLSSINTCVDYLSYLNTKSFNSSYEMIDQTYDIIYGDYEDIGMITTFSSNTPYSFLVLKYNDIYYKIDVYNQKKDFISKFNSIEEIIDNYQKENIKAEYRSYCLDDYQLGDICSFYLFGKKVKVYDRCGTKVYIYAGTEIPFGLGIPEYSDEEIQDIINQNDYEGVADKIHTLADAVNYITTANFTRGYNAEHFLGPEDGKYSKDEHAITIDINGCEYDDENLFYIGSGLETLQLRCGLCASAANLLTYLLTDDYQEVGYFSIRYSQGGHMMIYIKGNDSKYYLINPMDYFEYDRKTVFNDSIEFGWLPFYTNYDLGCADSLEELVDSFIDAEVYLVDYECPLKRVMTWTDRNRLCFGYEVLDDYLMSNLLLPTSAENGVVWFGDITISYVEPLRDTSQTYIEGFSPDRIIYR